MPGRLAVIVFLLALAWQIVSRVLQAAAKKQEQLRVQQEFARRRAAGEPVRSPGRPAPSAPPVEPEQPAAGAPRGQPLTEQERRAAARRAQIEALRARQRGGQQAATPGRTIEVRAGPQGPRAGKIKPAAAKPPAAPARGRAIRTLDAGFAGLRDQRAAEERLREAARRERDEDERQVVALEQAEESERLRRDKREKQERQRQAKTAAAEAPQSRQTQQTTLVTARTQNLRRLLRSSATVRQLFVLKELIDPPVALREDRL